MEQPSSNQPEPKIFELSGEGQRIRVLARHYPIAWGNQDEEISLGILYPEDTDSVDAEISFSRHQLGKFACYGLITIPDELAKSAVGVFGDAMRALEADHVIDTMVDDVTALAGDPSRSYLIHLDAPLQSNIAPEIGIYAKLPETSDWRKYTADLLDIRVHQPNEVVLGVGQLVAAVANVLHDHTNTAKSTEYTILLPEPAFETTPPTSPSVLPKPNDAPRPEHTDFPTLEQFGGLDETIKTLRQAVRDRFTDPSLLREYGLQPSTGILLYGPAGTGKTELVRALARDNRLVYREVAISEIVNKYIGESERQLREIFDTARDSGEPTLLLFDEFDGLFSVDAGGNTGAARTLANEFKTLLSNPNQYPNILVAATANSIDSFDPALLRNGRFDTKLYLGLPNESARLQIFAKHMEARAQHFAVTTLESIPLDDPVYPEQLAALTEGLSGADICGILQQVLRGKLQRYRETGKPVPPITHNQIAAAISAHRRTMLGDI